jgi:hypothetical protein
MKTPYFGTFNPKCPTLNAEFIRLLIPFKKPGDGTLLANAAAATELVGVA